MKKYLILLLLAISIQAQIKIGDITINESLAKEYFMDCHTHPDTVIVHRDNMLANGVWFDRFTDNLGNKYSSWDDLLSKCYLGEIKDTNNFFCWTFLKPRKPTAQDFSEWFIKHIPTLNEGYYRGNGFTFDHDTTITGMDGDQFTFKLRKK